jgi:hypothetical protein
MSWLREPLVHFLALGAAIFALARLAGDGGSPPAGRIEIGAAELEQLAEGFRRVWQRPPSADELAGLVEDRVREEVYYREALALGLDRADAIVRRRLRQKMEFLTEDTERAEPSRAELEAWLAAHREAFRVEPRVRFRHVYLSRERRGAGAARDAERLLAELRGDGRIDPATLGDPLPFATSGEDLSLSEVARRFGETFAARLFETPPGRFEGPIESAYGLHLVEVQERVPGRDPELAEVRDAVLRDWLAERRSRAREEGYRELRARYEVQLALPGPGDGSAAELVAPAAEAR